jgi:hypothetical protein
MLNVEAFTVGVKPLRFLRLFEGMTPVNAGRSCQFSLSLLQVAVGKARLLSIYKSAACPMDALPCLMLTWILR